jgi:hypothetical protein
MARIPGRGEGPAVLVVSHYDSREAAPGAGDDLAGVAAMLEMARAVARDGSPARDLILLFTDGEEAGLVGAHAFMDDHPWAEGVGVVLNLEARGNQGPSLMFETGEGDAEVVRSWASASGRPIGTSLAAAVYRRMPNDTDFSPFRRAGLPGLNFAFIGRVAHYHTAADTLENLSLDSVQHHGDQLLGLVRDLAWGPPLNASGDAVFFDVFGLFVVRWPSEASPALAAVVLALLAWSPLRIARRRRAGLRPGAGNRLPPVDVLRGAAAALLGLGAAAAAATGLAWLLDGAGATPTPFVAHPALHLVAGIASATLVAAAVWLLAWRCTFWGTFVATWALWGAGGLALAATIPGLCYPLLVPAAAAAVAAAVQVTLGREGSPAWTALTALLPLSVAAALLLPLLALLVDAMGVGLGAPPVYVGCLLLTALGPLVAQRRALIPAPGLALLALLALGAFAAAAAVPVYSEDLPRRLNVSLHVDAEAEPRWILLTPGELPEAFAQRGFSTTLEPAAPWTRFPAYVAPAPAGVLDPTGVGPTLDDVAVDRTADGRRRVRGVLRSRRGAAEAALVLPRSAILSSVSAGGRVLERLRSVGGQQLIWCHALPPGGLELELVLADGAPVEATVLDATPGLPSAGRALLDLRGPAAVSSYKGDQTIVSARVRF